MRDDLISVIAPVYNVERYLRECLDSVLSQTYSKLEIILVNDGSTDTSEKICREYCAKDSRFRLISQENAGLAQARNAGLRVVSGDWIAFVDSDDRIEPDMLDKLWNRVHSDGTRLAVCGMYSFLEENGKEHKDGEIHVPECVWNEKEYWNFYETGGPIICDVVWNKLYDAALWKNNRFSAGKKNEDAFIMHRIIGQCERISAVDGGLYGYRIHEASIMHGEYNVARLDAVEAYLDRTDYFNQKGMKEQGGRMLRQAIYYLVEGWHLLDLKEKTNRQRYLELRSRCRKMARVEIKEDHSAKTLASIIPFLAGERAYYCLFRAKELVKHPNKRGLEG